VHVYTKANGVSIKIVDGVKVLQECVTNEEQILVLSG